MFYWNAGVTAWANRGKCSVHLDPCVLGTMLMHTTVHAFVHIGTYHRGYLCLNDCTFLLRDPILLQVYKKYSNGTTLPLSAHVWSFVGYRKLSTKKTYDGGNFHFSKSMVCFRPCSRQGPCCGDGSCTLGALSGAAIPDKCCVDKVEEEGDPPPADAGVKAKLLELEKQAKRVPLESLGMLDGMKAF